MANIGMDDLPVEDRALVTRLLEPGEQPLRATQAEAGMARAGIVAIAFAVPAFAIGWFPLRKALEHAGTLATRPDDRLPFLLFAGFGLLWIMIALRLLWEPERLRRLYPHVLHLLTDRRMLAIDRRRGPILAMQLDEIRQMKILAPFGRVTFWRHGLVTTSGRHARVRNFDGVRDVASLAQEIANRTGVPVGITERTVAESIARMPPERRPRA